MNVYDMSQWVLLFFLYSLCGWIWECLYVSLAKKKWVNRGFLNGPVLPIYGFGAVVILAVTMPFREHLALVFLLGMIGATALEFATGFLMERIFGVKYWDYTGCIGSIKGYICMKATLCWGFFSVLLVKVIHRPLDKLLDVLPGVTLHIIVAVAVILFAYDTVVSVREALDLKAIIEEQIEHHFAEKWKRRGRHAMNILKRNPSAGSRKHRISIEELRKLIEKER